MPASRIYGFVPLRPAGFLGGFQEPGLRLSLTSTPRKVPEQRAKWHGTVQGSGLLWVGAESGARQRFPRGSVTWAEIELPSLSSENNTRQ